MRALTPLRYPGGKARLGRFFGELVAANGLYDGVYVEPYAGGAAVGIHLLLGEFVDKIYINDIDPAVYAFWRAILDYPDEFCGLVERVPLTATEWYRQKKIFAGGLERSGILSFAFAMFYLNRTNHSGILNAGMIGGRKQKGNWLLGARFNRKGLLQRIRNITRYRRRIRISNEDALTFLSRLVPTLRARTLLYLDPPYYGKGQHLYSNRYQYEDHKDIAGFLSGIGLPWVISYDNHPVVRDLYRGFHRVHYCLGYSARERRAGAEQMFFCHSLIVPHTPSSSNCARPTRPRTLSVRAGQR